MKNGWLRLKVSLKYSLLASFIFAIILCVNPFYEYCNTNWYFHSTYLKGSMEYEKIDSLDWDRYDILAIDEFNHKIFTSDYFRNGEEIIKVKFKNKCVYKVIYVPDSEEKTEIKPEPTPEFVDYPNNCGECK